MHETVIAQGANGIAVGRKNHEHKLRSFAFQRDQLLPTIHVPKSHRIRRVAAAGNELLAIR
jgi:hypothetical protein